MKKSILTITMVVFTTFVFSQITKPDTTKKEFKNIIELDASGFLQQYLFSSNPRGGFNVFTPYIISYKRFFNDNNAIRFGIGGFIYNDNTTKDHSVNNNENFIRKGSAINIGVGFEHYSYLTKRWNFFYGVDLIANFSENETVQKTSPVNTFTSEYSNYGFGISPLIGIQFKINSRISITTETSFDIVYSIGNNKVANTQNSSFDVETKSQKLQTIFNAPLNVNFRIHF